MAESTKPLNGDKLAKSDILLADGIEDRDASTQYRCIFNRVNVLGNTNNSFSAKEHILRISPIPRDAIYGLILAHLELAALA
jgi:hypothetical protein